ncbi:hypothetical protein [Pontibacter vulgaris]|uniref:hypothetical protein n=1 Tax=Pontibacter vulgaris TaxID=2905679 RepID=UPI001FA7C75F|nr:hypothetical protein [Pontibacter vulgaris]
MKKTLLIAITALLCYTNSFAQSVGQTLSREAEAKCTEMTREMAEKLRLNEPEYIKLKALNREHMIKTEEIRIAFAQDLAARDAKLTELKTVYEKAVVTILTPNQLQAYDAYKSRQNAAYMAAANEK